MADRGGDPAFHAVFVKPTYLYASASLVLRCLAPLLLRTANEMQCFHCLFRGLCYGGESTSFLTVGANLHFIRYYELVQPQFFIVSEMQCGFPNTYFDGCTALVRNK